MHLHHHVSESFPASRPHHPDGARRPATFAARPYSWLLHHRFVYACRVFHVYLSVLGLAVMLFFGLTGFTVHHEDWFGATNARVHVFHGQTPVDLIRDNDRLGIVEHLRSTWRISGAVSDYQQLGHSLSIAFKEPGRLWEVDIAAASGRTTVNAQIFNVAGVLNNLHRGRYTGAAWGWLMDISAVLIVIACLTGLVLWLTMPKRRQLGTAALLCGIVMAAALYVHGVPGEDEGVDGDDDIPVAARMDNTPEAQADHP
ncbi:MAG: PepSY-associated TM helix domain-containing protein [Burkholderiales bacterium]|nr:PepSY-associated TM helix domain-containing protein [Burkholderiales bacterium]